MRYGQFCSPIPPEVGVGADELASNCLRGIKYFKKFSFHLLLFNFIDYGIESPPPITAEVHFTVQRVIFLFPSIFDPSPSLDDRAESANE